MDLSGGEYGYDMEEGERHVQCSAPDPGGCG